MYSTCECSVCASAGCAVFVKDIVSGKLFLACPECGCAWARPPEAFVVDTIDAIVLFAPQGFWLATSDEITSAGLSDLVKRDVASASSSFRGMAGFQSR